MIAALKHCLKYEWHLENNINQASVIGMAVTEMRAMPQLDTWYSRVQEMKKLLGISSPNGCKESVSIFLGKKLNSIFDRFWLDQINVSKLDSDNVDHNKLRFYKTLKGSFTQEPYVSSIKNKSQRAWLTRFRVSAVSNLRIESGRYTRPITPITARVCRYCDSNCIDDEKHAIFFCSTFKLKRNCFIGKISALIPNFDQLNDTEKLAVVLCPANENIALCVSKYLGIICSTRTKLDQGLPIEMLNIYTKQITNSNLPNDSS